MLEFNHHLYLSPVCSIQNADEEDKGKTNKCLNMENFKPKYKFYEELRDLRKDKYFILKLRQSPGIKRRQSAKEVEERRDLNYQNESKA